MSTSSEWASVIVGGIQFAAGIGVASYTLGKQHNEGIAQRDGAWFHLVVADKTIESLHLLTESESKQLVLSAQRCEAILASGQPTSVVDGVFRTELQAFRARLLSVSQKVSNFAYIFDGEFYQVVAEKFRDLEDRVTEWFDRLQRLGPTEKKERLISILCDCQRELLQSFRDFEFVELPTRKRRALDQNPRRTVIAGLSFAVMALLAWFTKPSVAVTIHAVSHPLRIGERSALVLAAISLCLLTWAAARWSNKQIGARP